MNFHPRNSTAQRDSLAIAIECYLQQEAAAGRGVLKIREHPDGVTVSFGAIIARGETSDIAFVRIARLLLEGENLHEPFLARLRSLLPTQRLMPLQSQRAASSSSPLIPAGDTSRHHLPSTS